MTRADKGRGVFSRRRTTPRSRLAHAGNVKSFSITAFLLVSFSWVPRCLSSKGPQLFARPAYDRFPPTTEKKSSGCGDRSLNKALRCLTRDPRTVEVL